MPTISLQGQTLEVTDRVLHGHLLGIMKSISDSVGIIGLIQYDGSDQSLYIGYLNHLEELYQATTDEVIRNLLKKMINLYTKAQKCNDDLLELFSNRVKSPIPKTQSELSLLYKKLEKEIDPNWYPLIIAEKAPSKILEKQKGISKDLTEVRVSIIDRVIVLFPELIESDYIFDSFDDEAKSVAHHSYKLLRKYPSQLLEVEHFILAMLDSPNGVLDNLFSTLDINTDRLKRNIDRYITNMYRNKITFKPHQEFHISQRLRAVVNATMKKAMDDGSKKISVINLFSECVNFYRNHNERISPVGSYLSIAGITPKIIQDAMDQIQSDDSST